MPLKTPEFWRHRNWLAKLLLPASYVYLAAHRIKTACAHPYKSTMPVICAGGIVAGGSGKTPVVHAIVKLIRERQLGINPVILVRGYGGCLRGPTIVDPSVHTAVDVGDEALIHAAHAPTIVSVNRADGAKLAEAMGADIIVMDDGLQNGTIAKTLSFLVFDTRQGLGNGYLLPAGPLREPLKSALDKCACIIQTNGKADPRIEKPLVTTTIHISSIHDKTREVFAFAGLGNPDKFRLTLEENGFVVGGFKKFADHHPYSIRDIETLRRQAAGLPLITTHKDFVRIPEEQRHNIQVLHIEQVFDNPELIVSYLKKAIEV